MRSFNLSQVLIRTALLATIVVLFTSCATIMGRSKYDISINSEPSNASVRITDKNGVIVARGVTPFTARLKSSAGFFSRGRYAVHFSKEGYEDIQYPLTAVLDGNYFWNLFTWSLLGMAVDHATGAMWKFSGDAYSVPLIPRAGYSLPNGVNNNNVNTNNNTNNINIIIKKSDLEQGIRGEDLSLGNDVIDQSTYK